MPEYHSSARGPSRTSTGITGKTAIRSAAASLPAAGYGTQYGGISIGASPEDFSAQFRPQHTSPPGQNKDPYPPRAFPSFQQRRPRPAPAPRVKGQATRTTAFPAHGPALVGQGADSQRPPVLAVGPSQSNGALSAQAG